MNAKRAKDQTKKRQTEIQEEARVLIVRIARERVLESIRKGYFSTYVEVDLTWRKQEIEEMFQQFKDDGYYVDIKKPKYAETIVALDMPGPYNWHVYIGWENA